MLRSVFAARLLATSPSRALRNQQRAALRMRGGAVDAQRHPEGQPFRDVPPALTLGRLVPARIAMGLARLGYERLTPVQRAAVPAALGHRRDVVASAVTGTGKTEAYGIPLVTGIWRDGARDAAWSGELAPEIARALANLRAAAERSASKSAQPRRESSTPSSSPSSLSPVGGTPAALGGTPAAPGGTPAAPGGPSSQTLSLPVETLARRASEVRLAAIVVAPSKELVEQIGARLAAVAYFCQSRVAVCRAGNLSLFDPAAAAANLALPDPAAREYIEPGSLGDPARLDEQRQPARIVVSTPGALATWLESNPLLAAGARCVVVDECDKILDLGLAADMERVRALLPRPRKSTAVLDRLQTILVSATLPPRVWDLVYRLAPKHRLVQLNASLRPVDVIDHVKHTVTARRKSALVMHLLRRRGAMAGKQVLIFARTRQVECGPLI
jgi:superfamily II DNA/RNA helicase